MYCHRERQKMTCSPLGRCDRVAYIGFISFFIVNTRIFEGKSGLVRHINGLAPEIEELTQPIFHLGFSGLQYQQNGNTDPQPLWNSLFLLLKLPAPLSYKTCDFLFV